jgi:hypothetical protein
VDLVAIVATISNPIKKQKKTTPAPRNTRPTKLSSTAFSRNKTIAISYINILATQTYKTNTTPTFKVNNY